NGTDEGGVVLSLFDLNLQQIHNRLADKELSVGELIEESLGAIRTVDSTVKAFLHVDEEGARQSAQALDKLLAQGGDRGMLFGLPAGIKDNIVTEGLTTTCASRFLENYEPI